MTNIQSLWVLFICCFLLASCAYTEKVRDGRTAFDLKQFDRAIPMLQKDFAKAKRRTEQGQIAFLIGESLRRTNRMPDAIDWYQKAYDYQYGAEALKQYAFALKQQGEYKRALTAFRDLGIEIGSPYEYRKEMAACQRALEWQQKDRKAYRTRQADFNTSAFDYAPVLYEQNELVISSDRASASGEDTYYWTGRKFADLFQVNLSDGSVTPLPDEINTSANEGTVAFFKDEIIFTRCASEEKYADAYCQLFSAKRKADGWSKPEPLAFQQAEVNYGHPALSADGQLLVFSSDASEGWGGFDLYISKRTADGWTPPQLLSRSINTPRDEKFPSWDGDTLYFASDGHTGMGGLDVFRSYRRNNNWTPASNLQPPINSPSDDFGFVVDRRTKLPEDVLQRGYFTSSRPLGPGNDDIYIFEKIVLPPEPEPELPIDQKIILDVYVLEKVYAEPNNPNSEVLGRKPLDGARLLMVSKAGDQEFTVGADGKISVELELESSYNFVAEKKGYLNNQSDFSTKGIALDPKQPLYIFEIEIVLDKIYLNQEIVLENIYYDFDESFIRADAKPTLNELADILKRNPGIAIQMGSHTDCRGSDRYNEDLSQARAQSAVDYLIAQGIAQNRLTAKGYGENKPADDCACTRCSEEEHQLNRRTTFTILE